LPEEDWDPRSSIPDWRSWNGDFRNRCQGHFRPLTLAENVFRGLGIFRVRCRWAPLPARGKVTPAGTETEDRRAKLEDSTRLPLAVIHHHSMVALRPERRERRNWERRFPQPLLSFSLAASAVADGGRESPLQASCRARQERRSCNRSENRDQSPKPVCRA